MLAQEASKVAVALLGKMTIPNQEVAILFQKLVRNGVSVIVYPEIVCVKVGQVEFTGDFGYQLLHCLCFRRFHPWNWHH